MSPALVLEDFKKFCFVYHRPVSTTQPGRTVIDAYLVSMETPGWARKTTASHAPVLSSPATTFSRSPVWLAPLLQTETLTNVSTVRRVMRECIVKGEGHISC